MLGGATEQFAEFSSPRVFTTGTPPAYMRLERVKDSLADKKNRVGRALEPRVQLLEWPKGVRKTSGTSLALFSRRGLSLPISSTLRSSLSKEKIEIHHFTMEYL